jgi:hypothetical protein
MSGVKAACERLSDMISPLRKHTLLQPSRVASALDHLVNFLHGPLDGVTAPASAYRARELWKGLFWVFKQAIEVSAQAPRIRTRWRFLPGNSTCGARAIGLPHPVAGGVWNEAFSPRPHQILLNV